MQTLLIWILAFFTIGPSQQKEIVGLSDTPQLMPPYYARARQIGLEGSLAFTLHFDAGKVQRVVFIKQQLRSRLREPVAQRMESESFVQQFEAVLFRWTSPYKTPFSVDTLVQLQLDSKAERREYQIKYGDRGTISELIMIDSPLSFNAHAAMGESAATSVETTFYANDYERLGAALQLFRFDVGRCPDDLEELIEKQEEGSWSGPYVRKDFPMREFILNRENCSIERKKTP